MFDYDSAAGTILIISDLLHIFILFYGNFKRFKKHCFDDSKPVIVSCNEFIRNLCVCVCVADGDHRGYHFANRSSF